MNNAEALQELQKELSKYKARSHSQLTELISEPVWTKVAQPKGQWYQIKIEAFWDRDPGGDLHILGRIDDGGWRAWLPISHSFIRKPDGTRSTKSNIKEK